MIADTRRRFTAEDKLRILKLAEACTVVGSLGARLRTEGLYASNLTTWRRHRTKGMRSTLTPQTRGRTESVRHPLWAENETLARRTPGCPRGLHRPNSSSRCKKISQLLGIPLETPEAGGLT